MYMRTIHEKALFKNVSKKLKQKKKEAEAASAAAASGESA